MSNAKVKFDRTIARCNEMISFYDRLKSESGGSVPQDILRGAIVLSVAAFDAYATDCFSEYFVTYIKRYGVDDSLEELLKNAGFNIKFSLELVNSERPYRRIRTLIDKYYAQYTTQRFCTIDKLFLQYHIKDLTKQAAKHSNKNEKRLLRSIEILVERRHSIVHDGDYNDQNRIQSVDSKSVQKRINDVAVLVENMDAIISNKMQKAK